MLKCPSPLISPHALACSLPSDQHFALALCRPVSNEQAAAQSAWRLARRQWVAQLRSLLSPLQDPVASLRSYIGRIASTSATAGAAAAAADPASQRPGAGRHGVADGVPKPVGDALVAAAGQEARSAALKLLQVRLSARSADGLAVVMPSTA